VRVAAVRAGRLPPLADIRAALERDWRDDRRARDRATLYEKLRQRYDVIIETSAGGGS
jgi:hypothetical protein